MTNNIRPRPYASIFIFTAIILFVTMPLNASEGNTPRFNPDIYNSADVTYRSPDSGNSWMGLDRKKAARGFLMLGYLPDAVDNYKKLEGGDDWNELEPEYAYALSLSGYDEPAMLYLDDAHAKDPSSAVPYYYAGRIFIFAGYGDIAENFLDIAGAVDNSFSGPAGDAPGLKKSIGAVSYAPMDADFKDELGYSGKDGVVVLNVFPGPEKFITGIQTRDVIVSAAGKKIESVRDFVNLINSMQRGSSLELEIWRGRAKKTISVSVASGEDLAGLPAEKKRVAPPDAKAKALLVRAVTLLSEKKYFTSILIYRQLIEEYPGWEIPYLGYTLALEKCGAFECAKKAAIQARLAAENDKETIEQLKLKSNELAAMPKADQDNWIMAQTAESFKEKPASFYLGFGGGQLMFGGSSGFKLTISGRAGMLLNSGMDLSTNVGYDNSSGFDLGVNATQRYYIGTEYSLNPGASIDFNTGRGSLSIGVLCGGSWYFDNKRSSIDALLSLNAYIGNSAAPAVGFYLGTTRYM